MRKYLTWISLSFVLTALIIGCSESTDSSGTGKLNILLTDAPASFNSVNVVFREISAHIDSDWVQILNEPEDIDLLQYSNGETFLLASEDIDPGHYTQIRLIIDSAYVTIGDTSEELTVPSSAKTGLKYGPQFSIEEGSTYTLVIDFNADKSVVKNGQGYALKPHIRVIAQALSGSISGTVLNPSANPVATAVKESDTYSTSVDTSTGDFVLAFLPEGTYSVAIEDTNGLSFSNDNVTITPGQDNDLGNLTLE
jgi:hypothetical protein